MAWQSPSAGGGNGGAGVGGGDGSNNGGGQQQGTEYTLQGVMRFLQTEWHRHERDRNAWDIERAEMKARIAKLEGDGRTSSKLKDSLGKHVLILENALKAERRKQKAPTSGDLLAPDKDHKDSEREKLKAGHKPPPPKPHNSFLDTESEEPQLQDDAQEQKSQTYLDKCIQEITYLLSPPSHPPPTQQQMNLQDMTSSQGFAGHQQPMHSLEEVYLPSRQKAQQPSPGMSHPAPSPNHQPPPVPGFSEALNVPHSREQIQHASYMSRNLTDQQPLPQGPPLMAMEDLQQQRQQQQAEPHRLNSSEEQVEKVTHSYDSYGRPIAARQEDDNIGIHGITDEPITTDPDDWDFQELNDPPENKQYQGSEFKPLNPYDQLNEQYQPQRPDTDLFPSANHMSAKSPTRTGSGSHRRKSSISRRRSDGSHELREISSSQGGNHMKADSASFKVRFALRGHLDVVRSVIFTGGGSPSEPEICTTGDDGAIKRWIIPASYSTFGPHNGSSGNDLDIQAYFSHRGHTGTVTSLAACPASQNFSNGGRALGDGWVFSGGQDATVRVWERGRVDPKATLDGHTDAVWSICVLPASSAAVFGVESNNYGGPDRILLASGSADGTVKIWAVSAPPQLSSPSHSGSRRGVGGSRRHSVSSGSNFPSSPQPSTATATPFDYTLVHTISRSGSPSPTFISPLSMNGDSFVVSYADASVLIFDTRTGEEVIGMASLETYDGTPGTGVNSVVATTVGLDGSLSLDSGRGVAEDESVVHGATGSSGGIEGVVISGHEDQYIRFFDANSGQCTYTMLAHPSAISSLSLSPDGRELVSAGHDASLRFWSLEKRSCTQEITSHRLMRGEGVCAVVWSQDGRWVVSGGGDGVVKVFAR
ncbi:MAG: hypothetical protein M1827_003523 [Pycnora praestabilis]|nr:MAG: hypothetical protein M1827_003523 [Pycnora praestabilis]